jgi:hypothetical protein
MKTLHLMIALGACALASTAMASQQPGALSAADLPALFAKAEKGEKKEKAEKKEKLGAIDELFARAEKKEKAEKPEKKEKLGAIDELFARAEKKEKAEKPEKNEKKEKLGLQFDEELLAKAERSHGGRPRPAGKRGA